MRLPICLFIIWTGVVASRVILSSLSSTSPSASTANTTTTHHRDDSCSSHPDIRPRSPLSLPLAPRSRISRGCSEQHQDQLQYQLLGAVRVWSTEAALLAARYQSHMSQVDADLLFRINFGPDTIHNRAYVREHFRHIEREVDRSPGGEGHFHRLLPYGVSARLLTGRVTIACGESPVGHELCNEDGITYVRPVGLRRGMVVLVIVLAFFFLPCAGFAI